MSQSIRVVLVLLLGGLCTAVQANGSFRDCPSVVAGTDDDVSPLDLIWDVADGTSSGTPVSN
jgi:hypothetical protein